LPRKSEIDVAVDYLKRKAVDKDGKPTDKTRALRGHSLGADQHQGISFQPL